MNEDGVTLEIEGLEHLVKALKRKPAEIRVGILGGSGARSNAPSEISFESLNRKKTVKQGASVKQSSNAEIGAAHEFGAPARGLPQRSFLRLPLSDKLQKEMERTGAVSKEEFREILREATFLPWLEKISVLALNIVRGAFDTGGYGKWPKWKDASYTNNTGMVLVDTTQLRDSITSEVKE